MANFRTVTFEDNDLYHPSTGFDSVVINEGGEFALTGAAAMQGSYGCEFTPVAGYCSYAVINYRFFCTRFRFSFLFKRNTFSFSATGNAGYIIRNYGRNPCFGLYLYRSDPVHNIRPLIYKDDGNYTFGNYRELSDDQNRIEVDWKASSAPGANDGYLRMWFNDISQAINLENIDNDTRRAFHLILGGGTAPATQQGTCYYDYIRANNDGSVIGA